MGQINRHRDVTGSMTPDEIHTAEISTIVDELNRTSDNVESLLNNLTVSAYGSMSYIWDGVTIGFNPVTVTAPITTTGAVFPIVFGVTSLVPNRAFALPAVTTGSNANGDVVNLRTFSSYVKLDANTINIEAYFFAADTPRTYTFYYYLIQQPPNIVAS